MLRFFSKKQKGFTLIETLVAVSIFSISILAVMANISKSISDTGYTKKKVVAMYLSQEGIEYFRNLRDTYLLYDSSAQDGWNNFYNKILPCMSVDGCHYNDENVISSPGPMQMTELIIDYCSPTVGNGPVCPNNLLKYDDQNGKYGYSSGDPSGFSRVVRATSISSDEIEIISTVSWTQGSNNYYITFSENLFNWIEQ